MLKRLCGAYLALTTVFLPKAEAADFASQAATFQSLLGKGMVLSRNPVAVSIGLLIGAKDRSSETGKPLETSFKEEIGAYATNKAFDKAGVAVAAKLGGGELLQLGVGKGLGFIGAGAYNAAVDAPPIDFQGTVGGLQASLSQTANLTGTLNGIQQYNLLDQKYSSGDEVRDGLRSPKSDKIPRYSNQDGPLDPSDTLVGRASDNQGDDGFFGNFGGYSAPPHGRRNCGAPDVTTPNPMSCSGY